MFSRAGRTLTQIGGRYSVGINLKQSCEQQIRSQWHEMSLPASVEQNQPTSNREEWQEELSRDWEEKGNR